MRRGFPRRCGRRAPGHTRTLPRRISPKDLLDRVSLIRENREVLAALPSRIAIPSIVGFVEAHEGRLYNAAAVIVPGVTDPIDVVRKTRLPTYDVFDEDRWFDRGAPAPPVRVPGTETSIGVTICEDIWREDGSDPLTAQSEAGALLPIGDVTRTRVYSLARIAAGIAPGFPERLFQKAPTAELRPGQKDEDDRLPYEIMDPIIEAFVEDGLGADEIAERGHDRARVEAVLKWIEGAEFKRKQAPPILKVTRRAFGPGWQIPIAARR